jgi:hypothetical protein
MTYPPRRPVRHRPPRRRATVGDSLFALAIAGFGLGLAAAVLSAGGGAAGLAAWLPGMSQPTAGVPTARTTSGPILPSGAPATRSPAATPAATPESTPAPEPTPEPTATPTPAAARPFTTNLYRKGVFVHQVDKDYCVAAAVQNMLNVIRVGERGRAPDTSARTQQALYRRIVELTTRQDSHNGGTGPGGWAALLSEKGYPYEVRVYDTRNAAIRAAAKALRATGRPVGILAWGGVHSWVLTGFTATADPARTSDFSVTSTRILDPWYPWVSTIWPRSEKPNAPRDTADLKANIRPWKLASGPYAGRDGRYLLVVPLGS